MKKIDLDKVPPEARAKMEAKAAKRAEPIDNTELVLAFRAEGGGIMHIRPRKLAKGVTRGMTVAFKRKGGRMEIATAVQHRSDSFAKKIGCKTAIDHFRAGKTVTLPATGVRPVESLQQGLTYIII
jgi:hypothetical protein